MIQNLEQQLRRDEGEVLHAYKDSLGYLTIGVGRLIDQRKGGGLTSEESSYLLNNDIKKKTEQVLAALPWVADLDDARRGVILNMSFQLGVAGLLSFKNTLAYIKTGDYKQAALNMSMSKWHAQTPERCERLMKQMITGGWQ
jgi:lysozyme